jgi:hypothetical protein
MPDIEIGTLSNPIVFTSVIAGATTEHPNNPFYLWNDRLGTNGSVDAREITLTVLGLNITDELVGSSNGNPNQTFIVSYIPVVAGDSNNPVTVKVNGAIWIQVNGFPGYASTDEIYTFDYNTGTITFGNGLTGKVPPVGNLIEVSYTPDTLEYGTEVQEFKWLGVKSSGVVSNPASVLAERQIPTDLDHLIVSHTPVTTVTGVYLGDDSHKVGINYYTGGSYNAASGLVTLGTTLPIDTTSVLVEYTYAIQDDGEIGYTQIGGAVSHTFFNPIPSNNAKLIYLQVTPPTNTSPSGAVNLKFRLRLDFKA